MPWYLSTVLTFCLVISFYAFMEAFSSKREKNIYKKEYEKIRKEYEKEKLNELNSNRDKNEVNYIPKGTIKYIRLAMKYTHPDVGGSNEEFIKCNNIYNELKEKYKEV